MVLITREMKSIAAEKSWFSKARSEALERGFQGQGYVFRVGPANKASSAVASGDGLVGSPPSFAPWVCWTWFFFIKLLHVLFYTFKQPQ